MGIIDLKTAIPGPKAQAMLQRRAAAAPAGLAKSTEVVIESAHGCTVKDVDGNTQTFKYGFLFATGGSQENRFGMSLNSSPSATQYLIRYHAATMLRGKVLGQDITIFDDNSSGSFGDPVRVREPTNVVNDEFLFNDAIIFGKSKTAAPWTEFMEVDGVSLIGLTNT